MPDRSTSEPTPLEISTKSISMIKAAMTPRAMPSDRACWTST